MKKIIVFSLIVVLAQAVFATGFVALDPTRHVPSARVLGLAKAYLGLADDTGAMYTNPAGLAEAENWQLTSMSGSFLGEYSYLSFSGFYPTEFGTFGIGYAGTSIAGAFATTIEAGSDPNDPIYTYDYSQPEMGNQNNAYVLSYANELKRLRYLRDLPYAKYLSFGSSLKLFSARLYGDAIVGGDASGSELDFGLKIKPEAKWMKYGLALKNLLPSSLGGKLTYGSGHTESYPLVLQAGSVFQVLGKKDALQKLGDHDVKVMVDFDLQPTLANYPMTWHIGTEWWPLEMIAIRAGLDQDAAGDGTGGLTTVTDLAYGVGLRLGGFNFDMAYHTFAGAPNIDNYYFSMSYGLLPKKSEKQILINLPNDKLITFESNVSVVGKVLDPSIQRLSVNGVPVRFGLRGDFKVDVALKEGKNAIVVKGRDSGGKLVGVDKVRILRLKTFPDVPLDSWVAIPTSLLAMQNIITGYPDGSFKPEGNITRAEMCTLLIKTKYSVLKGSVQSKFKDVVSRHWAAPYIERAARDSVVLGYPDKTFKPKNNITRAEGLAMITRLAQVTQQAYKLEFPDINAKYWAADIIAGANQAGMLKYLENQTFEPKRKLTRAETVELLHRTAYVQDILNRGMLNWSSY